MTMLVLMRHGKAEAQSASGSDHERALVARGWQDCRSTAAELAALCGPLGLALVSSATRTQESWVAMQQEWQAGAEQTDQRLYLAPAETLDELVSVHAPAANGEALLLVGHNPGLHMLAAQLASQGESQGVSQGRSEPAHSAQERHAHYVCAARARLAKGLSTGWACVFQEHALGAPGGLAGDSGAGSWRFAAMVGPDGVVEAGGAPPGGA